jgi:malate dehydrogenase (oxaloacetate-decarboxylating)
MLPTSDAREAVFWLHLGGKIEVRPRVPLETREDLARVYTPGFTEVAKAIANDPDEAYRWSIKQNTVAIVSDGTAVSGLGDLGPRAAIPVMEGKALLFKRFAGIDAFPICLATKDVDTIVEVVKCIEPTFGGIMLEDIAAPRCFAIEDRLKDELAIPVLHDDQHAVAASVAAGLINASKFVDKDIRALKIVIVGAGAAGTASAKLFMELGVQDIIACDREGAIHGGRLGLTDAKRWFADHTNPGGEKGSLHDVLLGADVLVGLSGPGIVTPDDLRTMAKDSIVFALANPNPEILPADVPPSVAVIATGQTAYPNQIDGGLCYPGVFGGALRYGASCINDAMKLAAVNAIAGMVDESAIAAGTIVPDIFDGVAERVSVAVMQAALETGVAQVTRHQPTRHP